MPEQKRKILLTKTKLREKFEKRVHPSELERRKQRDPLATENIQEEFSRDVTIDRTKLDFENAKQSKLHNKYLKKYIKAIEAKLKAETLFNTRKARMAGDVRKNPASYYLEKTSEGAVQSAIYLHVDYDAAEADWLKALTTFLDLEGKMRIIRDRVMLLRNLSNLIDASYFTPSSLSEGEFEE